MQLYLINFNVVAWRIVIHTYKTFAYLRTKLILQHENRIRRWFVVPASQTHCMVSLAHAQISWNLVILAEVWYVLDILEVKHQSPLLVLSDAVHVFWFSPFWVKKIVLGFWHDVTDFCQFSLHLYQLEFMDDDFVTYFTHQTALVLLAVYVHWVNEVYFKLILVLCAFF